MQQPEKGCLPCGNCLVTVPQDKWFAVEMFGSFTKILGPGLGFTGFDLCGACVSLRSITSRIQQLSCQVATKTKDNVFVRVLVAVQCSVVPESAQDAFYKLTDVHVQIDSYVSDVVRSQIPNMALDEAFEEKDGISHAVQENLSKHMASYGFKIHKALITEIAVNDDVKRSMNEINKQKRLKDASIMAAEAEKIKVVKAAEAEADAASLSGEGIARQRAAIIDGLRSSIAETGREVSTQDITQLLLTTQYFETLKEIGGRDSCKAYFLPEADPNDMDAQIRQGMLEGQAALEHLRGPRTGGSPQQQQMASQQSQRQSRRPTSFQPPPSPSRPQATVIQLRIPDGAGPGTQLQARTPDGRTVLVTVPNGYGPGQMLQVQV